MQLRPWRGRNKNRNARRDRAGRERGTMYRLDRERVRSRDRIVAGMHDVAKAREINGFSTAVIKWRVGRAVLLLPIRRRAGF